MKRFLMTAIALFSLVAALATPADSNFGVGAQYDTTHVYVQPEDFDKFVASLVATFGGTTTKQGVFTVTPTPSKTMSQLVLTPAGTLSVFGFKTPVPYPFGTERTGYLVTNLDAAVRAAGAVAVVNESGGRRSARPVGEDPAWASRDRPVLRDRDDPAGGTTS